MRNFLKRSWKYLTAGMALALVVTLVLALMPISVAITPEGFLPGNVKQEGFLSVGSNVALAVNNPPDKGFTEQSYSPGWLSGWDQRVKLTVDNTDIDDTLANFPILVYLSASSGRNDDDVSFVFDELTSNDNRKRIAVTTDDGETECYVEIEKWDDANEKAWLWVKVPSIASDADTDLYLYYDKDHADNTDYVGDPSDAVVHNVWDANFKAVWHMRDDPDNEHIRDSTVNANDGAKGAAGAPAVTTDGKIDGAQDFSSDKITCGTGLLYQYLTFEAWVNPDSYDGVYHASIVDRSTTWWFFIDLTATKINFLRFKDDSFDLGVSDTSVPTETWTHVVATYDKDRANELAFFFNGAPDGERDLAGPIDTDVCTVEIGDRGATHWFDGKIDELRISDIARPSAWIKASYESERDHLLDFGTEETPVAPEITNSPGSKGYGILEVNTTSATAINFFTIENTGSGAVDITVHATDLTGGNDTWDLSDTATPGENIYGLKAGLDDDDDLFDVVVRESEAYNELVNNLAESATQDWGLKLYMPTSVTDYDGQQMSATLTLVCSAH